MRAARRGSFVAATVRRGVIAVGAVELVEAAGGKICIRLRRRLDVASVLRIGRSVSHGSELQHCERLLIDAESCLTKEDWTGRVATDQQRDHSEEGREKYQPRCRKCNINPTLDEARRPSESHRRQAQEGESFDGVHAHARPNELKCSRHDVDLDVLRSQSPHDREDALVVVEGESDNDALDVELAYELRETLERAQHGEVLEAGTAIARRVVDETDQVDPVLRVMKKLARDELTDVAGADDDRVLEVHQPVADARPYCRTSRDEQHYRKQPEHHRVGRRTVRAAQGSRARREVPRPRSWSARRRRRGRQPSSDPCGRRRRRTGRRSLPRRPRQAAMRRG